MIIVTVIHCVHCVCPALQQVVEKCSFSRYSRKRHNRREKPTKKNEKKHDFFLRISAKLVNVEIPDLYTLFTWWRVPVFFFLISSFPSLFFYSCTIYSFFGRKVNNERQYTIFDVLVENGPRTKLLIHLNTFSIKFIFIEIQFVETVDNSRYYTMENSDM